MCVSPQISQIWGEQEGNFQFLMAQRTLLWRKQSDAPPPLNILGLPYLLFVWTHGKVCPGRRRYDPGSVEAKSELLGAKSEKDLDAIEVRVADYITRAEDVAMLQQGHWRIIRAARKAARMTGRFAHLESRLNTMYGKHETSLAQLSSSLGDVHAQLRAISAKLSMDETDMEASSSSSLQQNNVGFKLAAASQESTDARQPPSLHRSAVMGSEPQLRRRPSIEEYLSPRKATGADGAKHKETLAAAARQPSLRCNGSVMGRLLGKSITKLVTSRPGP